MKKDVKRDIYVMRLYDIMLYYLYFKKYPKKIQKDIKKLYSDILDYMNDEEGHTDLDIKDTQFIYYEKSKSGREHRTKMNEDYFILDDFLFTYSENKYGAFSDSVKNKIEELRIELQKEIPDCDDYFEKDDDIEEISFIEEIEYEEPNN